MEPGPGLGFNAADHCSTQTEARKHTRQGG